MITLSALNSSYKTTNYLLWGVRLRLGQVPRILQGSDCHHPRSQAPKLPACPWPRPTQGKTAGIKPKGLVVISSDFPKLWGVR